MLLTGPVLALAEESKPAGPAQGQVTLSLPEWQSVWSAATKTGHPPEAPPKPPIQAAVQSAEYHARLEGDVLRCEAVLRVRSFSADWQIVPLAGGEWTMESPKDATVTLVRHDNQLCAVLNATGDFELKLPLSLSLGTLPGKFMLIAAAGQKWELAKPDASRLLLVNGQPPSSSNEHDLVYDLPPAGGEVVLKVEDAPPPAPAPPPVLPLEPSQWTADTQAIALFHDGLIQYVARVYVRAARGSGMEAVFHLPPNTQVEDVEGDDVAGWRQMRAADGSQRLVEVRWKTRDLLDRKLNFHYDIPQSPVASEWNLHTPLADVAGKALFAVAPLEGMEFQNAAMQKLATSQVTAWVRELIPTPEVLVIESGPDVVLAAKALPRVESAKATITRAEVKTRLVADGSVLNEVNFEFSHRASLAWLIELPSVEGLLRCQVDDKETRPVLRGKNQLEFSLPPSRDGSPVTSKVSFSYHSKVAAWDRVSGRIELDLPKTEVFVQVLHWLVDLPDGYEMTAASEGNVSLGAQKDASDKTVAFQKELFANEAPAVELFYQRLDLAK